MTLERAAELVSALRVAYPQDETAPDLFAHFVDHFDLQGETQLKQFAELCGFRVAYGVRKMEGVDNVRDD
jgi:hypothetical protein